MSWSLRYGKDLARIYTDRIDAGEDPAIVLESMKDKYNPDAEELAIILDPVIDVIEGNN